MDTDILRWANVVGRMQQFLRHLSNVPEAAEENTHISIREIQYGVHAWLRQLEFYAGLVADTGASHHSILAISHSTPEQRIMKMILTSTGSTESVLTTGNVRKKLRLGCENQQES